MRDEFVKWQVQCRISPRHKWKSKGTFETRKRARESAAEMRTTYKDSAGKYVDGYGLRNTRCIKKIVGGL